eukprot:2236587-Prymnesium_polylepis.1
MGHALMAWIQLSVTQIETEHTLQLHARLFIISFKVARLETADRRLLIENATALDGMRMDVEVELFDAREEDKRKQTYATRVQQAGAVETAARASKVRVTSEGGKRSKRKRLQKRKS